MDFIEILDQLNTIFTNVLDEENLLLSEYSTAAEVESWDSLTHIQLVVSIEKHFKIKFSSQEILQWKNVGEMIGSIQKKIN